MLHELLRAIEYVWLGLELKNFYIGYHDGSYLKYHDGSPPNNLIIKLKGI
jgi:hypothetical protein